MANPYTWPHVRRGSERFINELSTFLEGRGHDVTIISTTPAETGRYADGGITRLLYRQVKPPLVSRLRVTSEHAFSFQALHAILANDFDVIHCMSYFDGFGAALSKAAKKTRYVFHIAGIPLKSYFRPIPHDHMMFRCGLRHADATVVISDCAMGLLKDDFHADGEMIPIPVDLGQFRPGKTDEVPKILMVGDMDVARKGAGVLFRAFAEIKKRVPDAVLQLSGNISGERKNELFSLVPDTIHADIEVLGLGRLEDLPGLYSAATVTVLPSVWEAFGMVLVESLASGTPVVGADHGGIPDIIGGNDAVGRLFDPRDEGKEALNVGGLVEAIIETMELARREETPLECRRHVERFGWDKLGPRYEDLYYSAIER